MTVRLLVVGAGNRGHVYSQFALENPDRCTVVGVAEPREIPRNNMKKLFQIKDENCFSDWKDLAKLEKFADAVLICTQDQLHVEPAVAFANLKYHVLLEKPMAITEEDCKKVVEAIEKNKVFFAVGHVLRYTPMTKKVKSMLNDKVLGDILNIQHLEPVGFEHYAHSYIRGNWNNVKKSSFMLMTKSCHDIDWISYVMGEKIIKVNSFGALKHFKKENKPKDSGSRCLDCKIEKECPYSAKKIYLEKYAYHILPQGQKIDIEDITNELKTSDYGRCVYDSDNDVVDNQVVIMEFENHSTCTFTMISTTKDVCVRKTRIFGTKGQLEIDGNNIEHYDFLSKKLDKISPSSTQPYDSKMTSHGGADWHLMNGFITAIEKNDPSFILSGPQETLLSHLLVFEAEKKRIENNK